MFPKPCMLTPSLSAEELKHVHSNGWTFSGKVQFPWSCFLHRCFVNGFSRLKWSIKLLMPDTGRLHTDMKWRWWKASLPSQSSSHLHALTPSPPPLPHSHTLLSHPDLWKQAGQSKGHVRVKHKGQPIVSQLSIKHRFPSHTNRDFWVAH